VLPKVQTDQIGGRQYPRKGDMKTFLRREYYAHNVKSPSRCYGRVITRCGISWQIFSFKVKKTIRLHGYSYIAQKYINPSAGKNGLVVLCAFWGSGGGRFAFQARNVSVLWFDMWAGWRDGFLRGFYGSPIAAVPLHAMVIINAHKTRPVVSANLIKSRCAPRTGSTLYHPLNSSFCLCVCLLERDRTDANCFVPMYINTYVHARKICPESHHTVSIWNVSKL